MPSPTPILDAALRAEPDLVDRIFEYLVAAHPEIAALRLDATIQAVREEFRGERGYVRGRPATAREQRAYEVLALFNGRNAREVARVLRISRATVYRHLKQAGVPKTSLTFAGNETAAPVASEPSTDTPITD